MELLQRDIALQRANDVRLGRAQIKKEIRDGTVSIADVLESRPDIMDSMTVYQLLKAQKGWGDGRISRFLQWRPMLKTRRLGDLTDRERTAICRRWNENEYVKLKGGVK